MPPYSSSASCKQHARADCIIGLGQLIVEVVVVEVEVEEVQLVVVAEVVVVVSLPLFSRTHGFALSTVRVQKSEGGKEEEEEEHFKRN